MTFPPRNAHQTQSRPKPIPAAPISHPATLLPVGSGAPPVNSWTAELVREPDIVPFTNVVVLVDCSVPDCWGGGGVTVDVSSLEVLLSEMVVLGVLGWGVFTSELVVSSTVEIGGVEVCLVEDGGVEDGASDVASDVSAALLWDEADDAERVEVTV